MLRTEGEVNDLTRFVKDISGDMDNLPEQGKNN